MEKLQQLADKGKVITFFDGKLTLSQLVTIIIAIVVVLFALKVLKGALKLVISVLAICICLVHYGIASPTQIKDTAGIIAEKGISTYTKIADASDNIRIKGKSIELKINDTWVDISKVNSFIEASNGVATVIVDGVGYPVDDSNIVSLLKTFK